MSARGRFSFVLLFGTLLPVLLPAMTFAQTSVGWLPSKVGTNSVLAASLTACPTSTSCNGWRVQSGGADIGGSADHFGFVNRTLAGDGVMVARLDTVQAVAGSKVGIMIRESLDPGSKHAFLFVSGTQLGLQRRTAAGATSVTGDVVSGSAPVWLKLERRLSTITAYRSADGVKWTTVGNQVLSLPATVRFGLAVNGATAQTQLATFSSVTLRALTADDFTSANVGTPMSLGTTTQSGARAFTIEAGGTDVGGTTDQFRYVYQAVTGDVDVTARVTGVTQADAWSRAGLMMRASLQPDAAHASIFVSAANGPAYQRRPLSGSPSVSSGAGAQKAPLWVKLERRGAQVTALISSDRTAWTIVDTDTIDLPNTYFIGIAATSRTAASTTVVTTEQFAIAPPRINALPTVALTAPSGGARVTAGQVVTMTATAADSDGTIQGVDFFVNGTLVGTDTGAPYSVSWPATVTGNVSLTAVARDNDGATKTSAAVAMTVAEAVPATPTRRVLFNPSPDHDTKVDSYVLKIYVSIAGGGIVVPVAVKDLGKPAVVGGECSVDVSSIFALLPAGTFVGVVEAVGQGGTSASAASAPFSL